ncbi:MAG: hypothetical protein K2X38_21900 [Gemmataceae bacterium]|nr:hypothetical protein [Gemmataceae bacterium]
MTEEVVEAVVIEAEPLAWRPRSFRAAFPGEFPGTMADMQIEVSLPWERSKRLQAEADADIAALDANA